VPTPPGSSGNHPPPPHTLSKRYAFNFGAKIQIYRAKIQICGDEIPKYSAKTQICVAKIQLFDPKFKFFNFCTTKNLPLCTRKTTHSPFFVSFFIFDSEDPIGVGKKIKTPNLILQLLLRLLWSLRRTAALFRQIRTFPQLFCFESILGNSGIWAYPTNCEIFNADERDES